MALPGPHTSPVTDVPQEVAYRRRTPDIDGIIYSSLGESYIHTQRIPEAAAAINRASKANPSKAGFYLRNETILFFGIGDAENQLKSAESAIDADPASAAPYYFQGMALASKATVDPTTKKPILPPGCVEAYSKYPELDPNGQFSAEARSFPAEASKAGPTKAF